MEQFDKSGPSSSLHELQHHATNICSNEAMSFVTSLLEYSNDLIAAIDKDFRFVVLNAPFRREFEMIYNVPARLRQRLDEAFPKKTTDCERAITLWKRALAGESFRIVEDFGDEHALRKSYELTFNPIFDTNQQPLFAVLVARDRTLDLAYKHRYDALLNATPDAAIIIGADGTIEMANMHAERMFGYDRRQMLGHKVEKLIPERFRTRHIAHRNRFDQHPAARPMGSGRIDLSGLRADGSEFPVEISLSPLDVDGNSMVVASIRDMTLRQHAEDQLRELAVTLEQRIAERTAELEKLSQDNRATFEQASVGIGHVAMDGRWLRVNQKLCNIVGYTSEEMAMLTFQDITHPDDLHRDLEFVARLLNGELSTYSMEKRYLKKNGEIIWVELNASLVRHKHGDPQYYIAIVQDISARKHVEEQLQISSQSLQLAIEATALGMFDFYPQTGLLIWSPEAKRHFGLGVDAEVNYDIFLQGLHPDDRKRVDDVVQEVMRPNSNGHYHLEYRTIGIEDRKERWIDARGHVIFGQNGKPERFIGATLDITESKLTEERLRQMALHDPLTGLPNRGLLFEYAEHVFGRARRSGRHSGILFVDLDRFKPINDNHGHEVGDKVLAEAARRIVKCTRAEDIVFRLGGDEFLVLLPEIDNDTNAVDVASHMAHCVNKPYQVDNLTLSLSSSVGISIYPNDGQDIDTLINHADSAMYQAKQYGRNNIQFYSQELAARSQMNSWIEDRLKATLNRNDFRLYYQPIVDMHTAQLVSVEALLRWPHDDIGPERFVPVAEITGQVNRLGEWVLAEACRQHKVWLAQGMPVIPIAINVSSIQFRQKDFADRFVRTIQDCEICMSALQVELTETALMEHIDYAVDTLAMLKSLGIKIALDDFGTGYSSLNYLSRLPIDKIKVDKSFVQRIDVDNASRAITEAVIALGRTLKLEVIAEGIESKEALDYLRQHGCNQAQGYFVCEPVCAETFEGWYRSHCDTVH